MFNYFKRPMLDYVVNELKKELKEDDDNIANKFNELQKMIEKINDIDLRDKVKDNLNEYQDLENEYIGKVIKNIFNLSINLGYAFNKFEDTFKN